MRRELARDQSGHSRRARRPADQVAGPAMLKKRDRQPQDVPHEPDRLDQGQPDLEARQIDLLESGRRQPKRRRQGHGPEQRLEPFVVPLDQDLVNEDALKRGQTRLGITRANPARITKTSAVFEVESRRTRPKKRAGPSCLASRTAGPART